MTVRKNAATANRRSNHRGGPPCAEGDSFSFTTTIQPNDIDKFASASGDFSPIHTEDVFARARGFRGRMAHGGLMAAYVSRLVGMHVPCEDVLMHSMQLQFLLPTYVNDTIRVTGSVEQVSETTGDIQMRITIEHVGTGERRVTGKVLLKMTSTAAQSDASRKDDVHRPGQFSGV